MGGEWGTVRVESTVLIDFYGLSEEVVSPGNVAKRGGKRGPNGNTPLITVAPEHTKRNRDIEVGPRKGVEWLWASECVRFGEPHSSDPPRNARLFCFFFFFSARPLAWPAGWPGGSLACLSAIAMKCSLLAGRLYIGVQQTASTPRTL